MHQPNKSSALAQFLRLIAILLVASALPIRACLFPVQGTDLVGARFIHYYGPDDKAIFHPGFAWAFATSKLTITAGKQPIPKDLIQQLAAGAKKVQRIEASWKLVEGELRLSEIKVDGKLTKATCRLPLSSTAPGLFRIGERQYVFVAKQ